MDLVGIVYEACPGGGTEADAGAFGGRVVAQQFAVRAVFEATDDVLVRVEYLVRAADDVGEVFRLQWVATGTGYRSR